MIISVICNLMYRNNFAHSSKISSTTTIIMIFASIAATEIYLRMIFDKNGNKKVI
ncbi:hypothetical protein KM800_08005 [Clostridium tyrobutyricum]|uniref:hypothetical protein n=1 Tax=Clostridium tyrobutyricum TaxID=1519 RepID=UPI0012D8B132|nr:hypothetical protein [Clostridium tyrobutyricum]MBV4419275.1 hypothetical protein [Clostridium tyrobutyricum]